MLWRSKCSVFCGLLSSLSHAQSLCFVPSSSLLRYGGNLSLQSAMSVRFNSNGTQLLALRRRLPPVLYDIHSRLPVFQFDNQGYFNSCTMKSCCFAGDRDQVSAFCLLYPTLMLSSQIALSVWSLFLLSIMSDRNNWGETVRVWGCRSGFIVSDSFRAAVSNVRRTP